MNQDFSHCSNQAFHFSLNSTSCTRFKGLQISFFFRDRDQGHDNAHHGDRDRVRGEVGQCQVGVKGIVKNEDRGEIIRGF